MPKIPTGFVIKKRGAEICEDIRPENPVPRVFDAEDIWTQAGAGGRQQAM